MTRRGLALAAVLLLGGLQAGAESLILPVFAHNVAGRDGQRWSSELYLTNPNGQPVQVTLTHLLPGHIVQPAPCDLFMPPTRVVPPHSAVVWTASGLAVDLGCAEEALGALVLFADGQVDVTSRMVSHPAPDGAADSQGFLSGHGQEVPALALDELPPSGSYLLPALLWDRSPLPHDAFDVNVGFANPGPEAIVVTLDLAPELSEYGLCVDDREVALPFMLEIPPESWRQLRLTPPRSDRRGAFSGLGSFDLRVETYGPLAIYASVVDRSSGDPRTVLPVPLD